MEPSSKDLHPTAGARFLFERSDGQGEGGGPTYRVRAYMPDKVVVETALRWEDGKAVLEPRPEDDWVAAEAEKLARVLKKDPKPRLLRWRG